MRSYFSTIALIPCLLASLSLSVFGEELSWVSSFPPKAPENNSPFWLRELPREKKDPGEIRYEITVPPSAGDLLITVSFREIPGGFLKIFWSTAEGSRALSDNFYEGIDMPNRRSLLVSHPAPGERAVLTFQASQQDLHLDRIQWEWLSPRVVSARGAGSVVSVLTAAGVPLDEDSVSGDPVPVREDSWQGNTITAPLLDGAKRIEEGVEFEVQLPDVPKLARLEAQLTGLPLDKNLTVWINGKPSPAVALESPALQDSGYYLDESGKASYQGWRRLKYWITPDQLQKGSNKLQFSWGDPSGNSFPVALKDLFLQLNFDRPVPPLSPKAPALSSETPFAAEPPLDPLPVP